MICMRDREGERKREKERKRVENKKKGREKEKFYNPSIQLRQKNEGFSKSHYS